MKKLKIAMLAPIEEQVPPKKYGGTELIVHNLTEELASRGHDVTLLASGDSQTNVNLVPVFPKAIRTLPESKNIDVRRALSIIGAGRVVEYLKDKEFDIVHNHIGWMFLPFAGIAGMPVVTTFHGFLKASYEAEVYRHYADHNYISISMNQRESAQTKLNFIANVYNGINIEKFRFFPEPKNYFAFLARISQEKGAFEAIQIAKKARVNLVMAGKIDPVDEKYFKNKIEPLIDGEQIKFIGEIGHEEKVELLGNAKALIAPIQWEEPFGLYFIESMICGTPVIANRMGSVPEIIVDGKTGFIVDGIDEAVEKIEQIGAIERLDCHKHVKKNFSSKKMADRYLEAYMKFLG
ncbi:MAG: glycosyltransferase family 4 protein [Patescibacteria group bacterium]|jgi:glycosyltransferase involved in cell wall biosynthesis